jgi:hypothetical protein
MGEIHSIVSKDLLYRLKIPTISEKPWDDDLVYIKFTSIHVEDSIIPFFYDIAFEDGKISFGPHADV